MGPAACHRNEAAYVVCGCARVFAGGVARVHTGSLWTGGVTSSDFAGPERLHSAPADGRAAISFIERLNGEDRSFISGRIRSADRHLGRPERAVAYRRRAH